MGGMIWSSSTRMTASLSGAKSIFCGVL